MNHTVNCNTPFTRYNRLSNRYNRVDNRLYRVNKHPTGCQTGLTTVLNEQPLFVQQPLPNRLSNGFDNRFDNRLYRVKKGLKSYSLRQGRHPTKLTRVLRKPGNSHSRSHRPLWRGLSRPKNYTDTVTYLQFRFRSALLYCFRSRYAAGVHPSNL